MDGIGVSAAQYGLDLLFAVPKMLFQNLFYQDNVDYQTEKQKELFDYEAEYNSPEQQMQRLAAAGLNPYLLYSSSAPGGTSGNVSVPGGAMPSAPYNTPDIAANLLRAGQMRELDADTQLKLATANYYNKQSGRYDELMDATIAQIEANTNELAERLNVHRSDIRYQDAQTNLAIAEEAYKRGEISLQEFQKQNLVSQTLLYQKQSAHMDATTRIAKADALVSELSARYESLFYSEGRLKELSDADYRAAMNEFDSVAQKAAADAQIEGNAVLRWINWFTGQLGRALGGVSSAGSAYRNFKKK